MKAIHIILLIGSFLILSACENKNNELIDEYFFDQASLGTAKQLKIGDLYHGGKIAYIFQPVDIGYKTGEVHGIIACITDLPATYPWYNKTNIATKATKTEIGSGDYNSELIYQVQGNGNYAATACLSYTTGIYSNWFLPSVDELQILFNNKDAIGGFSSSSSYWSSSEVSDNGAYGLNFSTGLKVKYYKDGNGRVRPISYF